MWHFVGKWVWGAADQWYCMVTGAQPVSTLSEEPKTAQNQPTGRAPLPEPLLIHETIQRLWEFLFTCHQTMFREPWCVSHLKNIRDSANDRIDVWLLNYYYFNNNNNNLSFLCDHVMPFCLSDGSCEALLLSGCHRNTQQIGVAPFLSEAFQAGSEVWTLTTAPITRSKKKKRKLICHMLLRLKKTTTKTIRFSTQSYLEVGYISYI